MHILEGLLALAVFGAGIYGIYRLAKRDGSL